MTEKIAVKEFNIWHKFVNDLLFHCQHIGCAIIHNVSCDKFVIFIDFNDSSSKLINKEIMYIKKSYSDEFDLYGWKIYRPLVEKNKNPPNSDYNNCVSIVFVVE